MRPGAHFRENIFFKVAWASEFLFAVLEREWASTLSAAAHRQRSPGARP
jgi:hypothetical protein